jgi:phage terminase large subunit-like protein
MTISTAYSDWPSLTGRQEPHAISEFDGSGELGEKALTLAGRVGRRSMPWQVRLLFAILRVEPGGLWTHSDVVIICPRQNGKTLIVMLRILFGLFVLNERIIYTAQRWKTAEDVYKRLWTIIRIRRSLLRRVTRHTLSQGNGEIELVSGGKVLFCTRSADAGRGFDEVDLIVYDEAYNLTEADTSALNPTQMASRNPQTIYTSTPGWLYRNAVRRMARTRPHASRR